MRLRPSGPSRSLLSRLPVLLLLAAVTSPASAGVSGPGWLTVTAPPLTHKEAQAYYGSRVGAAAAGVLASAPALSFPAPGETPEILALARGLQHDPRLIYEYVRNQIDYVPYFGALKGALLTCLDGSGNDFDQAALLIALLKASGVDNVRFVYGTMTVPNDFGANDRDMQHWLGVDANTSVIEAVLGNGGIPASVTTATTTLHRVWVEATIGTATYTFDPAFKTYEETPGIDLAAAMGFDGSTLLSVAGGEVGTNYVRSLDEAALRDRMGAYTLSLAAFLRTHYPGASMEEIVGGRKIVPETLSQYPTDPGFPATILDRWDAIPDAYVHTARIQHGGIDETLPIPNIAGRRLALTYVEGGAPSTSWAGTESAVLPQTLVTGPGMGVGARPREPCHHHGST